MIRRLVSAILQGLFVGSALAGMVIAGYYAFKVVGWVVA